MGHLRIKRWPWVAVGGPVARGPVGQAESGRLVRRMSHRVDPAAIAEEARTVRLESSLAVIVLKLPRVSYPAKASAATRDAKCLGAGRERPQGLSRPFSSRRMWSVSAGF